MDKRSLFGITCFMLLALPVLVSAQSLEWVHGIRSTQSGAIHEGPPGYQHTVADKDGNVYTVGLFGGTMDFDKGAGKLELSATVLDIFLAKFDEAGSLLWVKKYGGSSTDQVYSIGIDKDANLYLTGYFMGTATYSLKGGGTKTISAMSADGLCFSTDSAGQVRWVSHIKGSKTGNHLGIAVAVGKDNNVYFTGTFHGVIDSVSGTGGLNLGYEDARSCFILKFATNGTFDTAWAFSAPTRSVQPRSIGLDDSSNIYITGNYFDSIDFDPGSGVQTLPTNMSYFICKLSSSGAFQWVKPYTTSLTAGRVLASGGVCVYGSFSGAADLDPGPGVFNVNTATHGGYIVKLDASGNFVWAHVNSDKVLGFTSVFCDKMGDIYAHGLLKGTTDLDPGAGTFNMTCTDSMDAFLLKLNADGNFIWALRIGSNFPELSIETAGEIFVDEDLNLYACGYSQGKTDFDPGGHIFLIDNDQHGLAYLQKFNNKPSGIMTDFGQHNLLIYPNPANDQVMIMLPPKHGPVSLRVTDMSGRCLFEGFYQDKDQIDLDLATFSEGIYAVEIKGAGFLGRGKFVKR